MVSAVVVPFYHAHHRRSGPPANGDGQTNTKPVLTLAVTNIETLQQEIDTLGQLLKLPDVRGDALEMLLRLMTGGLGADGINPKLPWGVTLLSSEKEFQPVLYIPTNKPDELANGLQNFFEAPKKLEQGISSLTMRKSGDVYFCKPQAGYLYFAKEAQQLENLATNAADWLGTLPKDYSIAVRVHLANVPEAQRREWLEQFHAGVRSLGGSEVLGADVAGTDATALNAGLKNIEELDSLTLGLKVHAKLKTTHLDFAFTAKPESRLAALLNEPVALSSQFASFFKPDLGLALRMSRKISPQQLPEVKQQLNAFAQRIKNQLEKQPTNESEIEAGAEHKTDPAKARAATMQLVDQLNQLLIQVAESGQIDAACSVEFGERSINIAGAFAPLSHQALEKLLHELVAAQPNLKLKKQAQTAHGLAFHTLAFPVPEARLRELVGGQEFVLYLAAGPQGCYFGGGKDGLKLFSSCYETPTKMSKDTETGAQASVATSAAAMAAANSTAKIVKPLEVVLSAKKLFHFAASLTMYGRALSVKDVEDAVGEQDHINVQVLRVPNGEITRLDSKRACWS